MQGDPLILIREFSKNFCLFEAMDAAGYRGRGRIYEAVRDLKEHAQTLRHEIGDGIRDDPQNDKRLMRIIGEYERIAFADSDENVRTADRLKALDVYRALTAGTDGDGDAALIINYDYGDGG